MKITFGQYRGFTLIELMIVIGIIGILAGVSLKLVSDTRKKTQVNNACESVVALANKARGYALSGINNTDSIRLRCDKSAATCVIERHAVGSPVANYSTVAGESALTLPQGAQFSAAMPATFGVTYSLPYGGGSGTVNGTINLNGGGSPTRDFSITNFGASCQ
jgi:prepilin-type N-terminal cleavage/methylation domain-containing protein